MQGNVQSAANRLPRMPRHMRVRSLCLAALAVAIPFGLWSLLPVGSSAQSPGAIQRKIERKESQIGGHKARERVLTTDISSQTARIGALQGGIDRLSAGPQRLPTRPPAKRAARAPGEAPPR